MLHRESVALLLGILAIPAALGLFRASRNWHGKDRETLEREIRNLTK